MNTRIFETIFFGLVTGFVALISTPAKSQSPLREFHNLNQREHFTKSALDLLVQSPVPSTPPQTQVVPVTQIKLVPTKTGIQVILTTPIQAREEFFSVPPIGNESLIWLKNTRLQLPSGKEFHIQNPLPGITDVYVTQQDDVTVQVRLVGQTVAPTASVVQQNGLLFVEVRPATSTAQQRSQQQPTPQQKPSSRLSPEPIEIVVTGKPDTAYKVNNTTTATKTPANLLEIPATVQVFPRQVLDDLDAQNQGEVLRTAGIITTGFPSTLFDSFSVRGFGSTLFRNGLKDLSGINTVDTANTERIELLRGPASVLYGQLSPGGVINRVTKQPLSQPYYFGQVRVGSEKTVEPSIDFSGPLNQDRTLLYRLNADYLSADSFVDFVNRQRYFVAPALTWLIGKNTSLTVEGEYQDVEYPNGDPEAGLIAAGTVLPNPNGKIPRSRNLAEPSDSNSFQESRIAYHLEHRFSDNWVLRIGFQYGNKDTNPARGLATFLDSLEADNRTLDRIASDYSEMDNEYFTDTNLTGQFKTGSIEHKLLVGFDLFWLDIRSKENIYPRSPIDLFNPVYGTPAGPITGSSDNSSTNNAQGVYLQDQISLTDNLKFLLGGRFDWLNRSSLNNLNGRRTSQDNNAFSPRLGIVYQPIKPISLYASYSQSFQQVIGTDAQGNSFEPSRGTQYEVGVKTDLLNNKLSTTLAFYDLTQTNLTTVDPNNSRFRIQTGEERSRGIELYSTGEIAPGWNIIFSYNYIDPRITKDNSIRVGNFLNVPQNTASLWTTYIIPTGSWKGFGGGLGLFYVGDRYGDLANTFTLPSYFRTDAALYYRRNNLRVQLNLQNLFNTLYYVGANGQTQVFPGAPFEAYLSVGWQF
ncbi:MAG: TonB-dependent siderophore receptor [Rhizonema sp. PD37]|nr:TonB-dependent siderophore receptor [Rhizonema sp. PD37]